MNFGGHSTAAMAASVANQVQAKVLAMNHISAGHQNIVSEQSLVDEASGIVRGGIKVQLAYDLMDIYVPRKGFPGEWK